MNISTVLPYAIGIIVGFFIVWHLWNQLTIAISLKEIARLMSEKERRTLNIESNEDAHFQVSIKREKDKFDGRY